MTSITTKTAEIYLDKEYVTVLYKPELKAVEILWKNFAPSKQYRETMQLAYKVIASCRAKHWLSDMTYAGVVSIENQKWMKKEFIPRALKLGIEKIGFVASKDIFNKMYTDDVKNLLSAQSGAQCHYFSVLSEAENWLRS